MQTSFSYPSPSCTSDEPRHCPRPAHLWSYWYCHLLSLFFPISSEIVKTTTNLPPQTMLSAGVSCEMRHVLARTNFVLGLCTPTKQTISPFLQRMCRENRPLLWDKYNTIFIYLSNVPAVWEQIIFYGDQLVVLSWLFGKKRHNKVRSVRAVEKLPDTATVISI